jgi:hypothetical protein
LKLNVAQGTEVSLKTEKRSRHRARVSPEPWVRRAEG